MERTEVTTRIIDPITNACCYVIEKHKKAIVIDPGSFDTAEKLEKLAVDVEWIFLTHEHCDHMAGMEGLRTTFPQVRVLASAACSKNLKDKRKNMSSLMGIYLFFRNGEEPAKKYPIINGGHADVVFEKEMTLDWRGLHFEFVSLPGHTEGSCGILLNQKIFFSGDYLIPGEEVLTRFPGGDEESFQKKTKPYLEALSKGIHVYPGHGDDFRLQ